MFDMLGIVLKTSYILSDVSLTNALWSNNIMNLLLQSRKLKCREVKESFQSGTITKLKTTMEQKNIRGGTGLQGCS